MKKADAERLIIAEMRKRLPVVPYKGSDGGMTQFVKLKKDRPELFEFSGGATDQWQTVQSWLKKHRLVAR